MKYFLWPPKKSITNYENFFVSHKKPLVSQKKSVGILPKKLFCTPDKAKKSHLYPKKKAPPAEISHDSDRERPKKVASSRSSIHTHFPKDRNCEVCKRIKITRAPNRRKTGDAALQAEKFCEDYSRSQSPQRSGGTSSQSSIFSRGTGCGHSTDVVAPEQNRNFSVDGNEFTTISRTVWEAKSHLHWEFVERSVMESSYFHISSIWNKWDCRKSSAQNKRRNTCSIVAIWLGRKMVGGFRGVSLPSAKHSRSLVWWVKHNMKGSSECPSTDQWYRLEQWSNSQWGSANK